MIIGVMEEVKIMLKITGKMRRKRKLVRELWIMKKVQMKMKRVSKKKKRKRRSLSQERM